jgi:predicted DsbA family dithiol-disulfide isomerase
MRRIEVFADMLCPFAYVGLDRLLASRDDLHSGVHVRVRAWPLEWVNGRPLDPLVVEHEGAALRAHVAPDLFRGFDAATFPRTAVPAFGLAAAAYASSDACGEAMSLDLRRALFEDGRDIADEAVLHEVGARHGVVVPDVGAAAATAQVDWERGHARGVIGSPHFFVGDEGWFCPSLRVSSRDGAFDVRADPDAVAAFYRDVFA